MKNLLDLNPRWLRSDSTRLGMGVSFDCPHCSHTRIVLWFRNPIDGKEQMDSSALWTRDGVELNKLSLDSQIIVVGHWEGLLQGGKLLAAKLLPAKTEENAEVWS